MIHNPNHLQQRFEFRFLPYQFQEKNLLNGNYFIAFQMLMAAKCGLQNRTDWITTSNK
jgi:hypothetical protein